MGVRSEKVKRTDQGKNLEGMMDENDMLSRLVAGSNSARMEIDQRRAWNRTMRTIRNMKECSSTGRQFIFKMAEYNRKRIEELTLINRF